MALPLSAGSVPEIATVTKDVWTKVAGNVNLCAITSNSRDSLIIWFTYVNVSGTAPSGKNIPRWRVGWDEVSKDRRTVFQDSVTARDIYVLPDGEDASIYVEA